MPHLPSILVPTDFLISSIFSTHPPPPLIVFSYCLESFVFLLFFSSPLFLGNLWDVTDRDIDRYTEALLQGWLGGGPGAPLLYYVNQARQAPRLKYLIGAAPVAYGLPVSLR